MPNLPTIDLERFLNVAFRKGDDALEISTAFTSEQPHIVSGFGVLADNLAVETGIHPALVYGIMITAATTFYLALTEQIKANESGTIH